MRSFTLLRVGIGGWAAFRYVKSVHVCRVPPWVHPPHPGRGFTICRFQFIKIFSFYSERGPVGRIARFEHRVTRNAGGVE